ncbi:MAG: hypothetical protein LBT98_01910 [Puniceicoccales bacterium]|jgi:hypothetical protein|nr:hypothetical protein [Puniceicoccales bacterium]
MATKCIKAYLSQRLADFVDRRAKERQLSLSGWIVRLIEREEEGQGYGAQDLQRQYDAIRARKNGQTFANAAAAIAYLHELSSDGNDSLR